MRIENPVKLPAFCQTVRKFPSDAKSELPRNFYIDRNLLITKNWLYSLKLIPDLFPNEQNRQLADCNRHVNCNHPSPKTELFKWV